MAYCDIIRKIASFIVYKYMTSLNNNNHIITPLKRKYLGITFENPVVLKIYDIPWSS